MSKGLEYEVETNLDDPMDAALLGEAVSILAAPAEEEDVLLSDGIDEMAFY
jgi:hypothetical protein